VKITAWHQPSQAKYFKTFQAIAWGLPVRVTYSRIYLAVRRTWRAGGGSLAGAFSVAWSSLGKFQVPLWEGRKCLRNDRCEVIFRCTRHSVHEKDLWLLPETQSCLSRLAKYERSRTGLDSWGPRLPWRSASGAVEAGRARREFEAWRLLSLFRDPPGGEFHEASQPITRYLWRVEHTWNLAEDLNHVGL